MEQKNPLTEQLFVDKTILDEKDLQILKLLQENAKLGVRDVAGKVHLSCTPTHERIKRMEQQGAIKQHGALPDHKKINKGLS